MPGRSKQQGMTMVEILTVVSILGIFSYLFMNFMHHSTVLQTEQTAQGNAKIDMDRVSALVAKDMLFISDASVIVGSSGSNCDSRYQAVTGGGVCPNFTIARNGVLGQPSYSVSYSNTCRNIPNSLAALIPNDTFTALGGSCYQNIQCERNKYPQINISVTSSGPSTTYANYAAFPDLDQYASTAGKGVKQNVVGAAMCLLYNSVDKFSTLHIDFMIITASGAIKVLSQDKMLLEGSNGKNIKPL